MFVSTCVTKWKAPYVYVVEGEKAVVPIEIIHTEYVSPPGRWSVL